MTEKEAYGNRTYHQRVATWYSPGDKVTVGPAYVGNGNYVSDEAVGSYTVVKKIDSAADYKVCRGDSVGKWDVIIHASRLTRR